VNNVVHLKGVDSRLQYECMLVPANLEPFISERKILSESIEVMSSRDFLLLSWPGF